MFMPQPSPMTKSVNRACKAMVKRIKAKSVPIGMYIAWTPGNKEQIYCQQFAVSAYAATHTPVNLVEEMALKCVEQLELTIMMNKPSTKSTFYVRSNLTFSWTDDPNRLCTEYTCHITGAWDKQGLMRKPRRAVIGVTFKRNFLTPLLTSRTAKLPQSIKIVNHNACMWQKNGNLTRKAFMAVDSTNSHHYCYLTRHTLRKYYHEVTPMGLI